MRPAINCLKIAKFCKENLSYDPDTGILTWLPREPKGRAEAIYNGRFAGKIAGAGSRNYRYVRIGINLDGKKSLLLGHRIAWLLYYGEWPDGYIDHINHDGFDNRIINIRLVSKLENARNMSMSSRNNSGYTGVFWSEAMKKWRVSVCREVIGHFSDLQDAAAAVAQARKALGYHDNHGDPAP